MSTLIPLRPVSNRADALSLRNRVEIQGDFCMNTKEKFQKLNKHKENKGIYMIKVAKIYNQKRKDVTLYSDFS